MSPLLVTRVSCILPPAWFRSLCGGVAAIPLPCTLFPAHRGYLWCPCKYPIIIVSVPLAGTWVFLHFPFARLPPLRGWVSILLLVPYSLHAEGISGARVNNLSSCVCSNSCCLNALSVRPAPALNCMPRQGSSGVQTTQRLLVAIYQQ